MFEKLKWLFIIWVCVTFSYLFLAWANDTWDSMADSATTEFTSQNLSADIVGIQEAVGSSNYWKWVIPGLVGMVSTIVVLREEIMNRVTGES